jgi:hypothetical protein
MKIYCADGNYNDEFTMMKNRRNKVALHQLRKPAFEVRGASNKISYKSLQETRMRLNLE